MHTQKPHRCEILRFASVWTKPNRRFYSAPHIYAYVEYLADVPVRFEHCIRAQCVHSRSKHGHSLTCHTSVVPPVAVSTCICITHDQQWPLLFAVFIPKRSATDHFNWCISIAKKNHSPNNPTVSENTTKLLYNIHTFLLLNHISACIVMVMHHVIWWESSSSVTFFHKYNHSTRVSLNLSLFFFENIVIGGDYVCFYFVIYVTIFVQFDVWLFHTLFIIFIQTGCRTLCCNEA